MRGTTIARLARLGMIMLLIFTEIDCRAYNSLRSLGNAESSPWLVSGGVARGSCVRYRDHNSAAWQEGSE